MAEATRNIVVNIIIEDLFTNAPIVLRVNALQGDITGQLSPNTVANNFAIIGKIINKYLQFIIYLAANSSKKSLKTLGKKAYKSLEKALLR